MPQAEAGKCEGPEDADRYDETWTQKEVISGGGETA